MPVIPSAFNATKDTSAVLLPRYAQIIRYDENAFFGINAPGNRERGCRDIWTKIERDMIARYLGEAQVMIEGQIGFPLGQKWFVDEQHRNLNRVFTDWARVQALGTRAVSTVENDVPLDHSTDPATIPATATTVTNESEIHFYIAGTDDEVYPDSLTVSAGLITASFPRARLVKAEFQDNPKEGWPYENTGPSGPFAQELDVRRVYTDSANTGEFVWPLGKDNCPECTEDTEPACGYLRWSQSGIVTLLPQNSPNCIYRGASVLRLNYCAGQPLAADSEDAIIHLAHALMPTLPCDGCDPLSFLWKTDRSIPDQIPAERDQSMFGVNEGAWRAWQWCMNNRYLRPSFL